MSLESGNSIMPDALGTELMHDGILVENWGKGDSKTVSHLYSELEVGDCQLVRRDSKLIRLVQPLNISVYAYFDGHLHVLTEDRQVFDEGTSLERVRYRRDMGGAVKEKVRSGENPDAEVSRAVYEELGIEGVISFNRTGYKVADMESPSYPGLLTQYRIHYYDVTLIGGQIRKEGYKEVQPDKTTYFVWTSP